MRKRHSELARRSTVLLLTLILATPMLAAADDIAAAEEPAASPYAPIEFLIGTWELAMSDGSGPKPPPTMGFAWGEKKTHVKYSGMRPENGELVPEFEGIIAWNGAERRLVFLGVYTTRDDRLVIEDGWIETLGGGAVRRHMRVHYHEGVTLPWSDGAVAGPEGHTLEFRQTWTPTVDGGLQGDFRMRRGESWQTPDFGHPLPEGGIRWRRLD